MTSAAFGYSLRIPISFENSHTFCIARMSPSETAAGICENVSNHSLKKSGSMFFSLPTAVKTSSGWSSAYWTDALNSRVNALKEIADHPQRRRLPAPRRPEDAQELAIADLEVERLVDGLTAELETEPAAADGVVGHSETAMPPPPAGINSLAGGSGVVREHSYGRAGFYCAIWSAHSRPLNQ